MFLAGSLLGVADDEHSHGMLGSREIRNPAENRLNGKSPGIDEAELEKVPLPTGESEQAVFCAHQSRLMRVDTSHEHARHEPIARHFIDFSAFTATD